MKTDYNMGCYHRDGAWGQVEASTSEFIDMHMAATCLHYGQEAFEGMKAYRGPDKNIRLFRWQENSKRLNRSARALLMPGVPEDLFKDGFHPVDFVITREYDRAAPLATGHVKAG